jgi:hypothetical protein
MSDEKNALMIAGERIDDLPEEVVEIMKMIGRHEAFGMIAGKTTAAWAECLKRLKEAKAYKVFNLTWEEFCPRHLSISRETADRVIRDYNEFGAMYFALSQVTRISRENYRLLAGKVTDGQIDIGGELIPITKANQPRIEEYIRSIEAERERKTDEASHAKAEATKARKERDEARKAATAARDKLADMQREKDKLFPHADGDHSQLLRIQSGLDLAFAQLTALGTKDVSEENRGRLIGLMEYAFRQLAQIEQPIREKFGVGYNRAEPMDALSLDMYHPESGARNLMAEYIDSQKNQ